MASVTEKAGPTAAPRLDGCINNNSRCDANLESGAQVTISTEALEHGSDPRLQRLEQLQKEYGSTWNGPDDPDDPYNWAEWRKISIGIIFSSGQLVTLMTASMISAALQNISNDLHIDAATSQIVFATFFLGLAFGPFIVAALAEEYGRKWVWVFGNVWYILWNAISPVGNSKVLMIIGRLMTGLGSSTGVTLTGPAMADMYGKKDRGKAVAIASLLPYLGPALGPIIGGLITQHVEWQWIFWIMSAFDALPTLLGLFCIRESYTPVLLRRKAQRHRKTTAAAEFLKWSVWKDVGAIFLTNLWRPCRLLLKRPIIQLIGVIVALNFAIYTILIGTYAELYMDKYGETQSSSSLHYIAIAIGASAAAQGGGRLMDWSYRKITKRNNGHGKPEFRVPYLIPGVVLQPIGLFVYGWVAEYVGPWPVVDIGAAIFVLGSFMSTQMLYAYQLDEFTEHAASANAATRVLSYSLGFAFPIFAPDLYSTLGYGWGNSLLAFLWIVVCFPLPLVIWVWGERLRALGKGSNERQVEAM